jgi:hypothetical protein
MHTPLTSVTRLSDAALVEAVKRLARRERDVTVELVAHLAEVEERGLHHAAGYSSMFTFCTEALLLSEHAAYGRIAAARASRKFPVILDMLADGSLNVTTVGLIARHLTRDNHREVLAQAKGRTKRQVEELVARLHPQPDVPCSIRKLPAPVAQPSMPVLSVPSAEPRSVPAAAEPRVVSLPAIAPPSPRPTVAPLAPDRYKIQFTTSAATCAKLQLAQDLLRHAVPDGNLAEIVDRALTLLLDDLAKRKFADTDRPRAARETAPDSRHVPAEVKREVWARDGGCCAFVGGGGKRCEARAFLESHHIVPWAIGGETTAQNVSLRCALHNRHESERVFGPRERKVVREVAARYGSAACDRTEQTRSGPSCLSPNYPP